MAQTKIYRDFSLDFTPHPVTGDVSLKTDADAVKASVRNLILTHHYERKFHSEIGTTPLLFELAGPTLELTIKQEITYLIENFEPRANLLDVIVNLVRTQNRIEITVRFEIINTIIPVTLNVILERTR